jgi:hypothetical protein
VSPSSREELACGEEDGEQSRGAGDRRHPGAHVVDLDVPEDLEAMIDPLRGLEISARDRPEQRADHGDDETEGGVDLEAEPRERPDDGAATDREDAPADQSDHGSASRPELHLFVLWSRARKRETEILDDIRSTFRVVDVMEVTWSRRGFAENLTRFYGQKLPHGSRKQLHCGSGPFLVVVVEDERPTYMLLPGSDLRVNSSMWEARARYRTLTGGGHRVHATLDVQEFEHDLFLLLGDGADRYRPGSTWEGRVERIRGDTTGTGGWRDLEQLYEALSVTMRWVIVGGAEGIAPDALAGGAADLELLVDDAWWGHATILGRGRRGSRRREVDVGGRVLAVDVWAVGDGLADVEEERMMLERRVALGRAFVPSAEDVTLLAARGP